MTFESKKTHFAETFVALIWSMVMWMNQSSPATSHVAPSIERQPPTCSHLEEELNQVMRDWR